MAAAAMPARGRALWFTGLPGSGKSTIAGRVYQALDARGVDAVWLQMDQRRKDYFPEPEYTEEERRAAYELFAREAAELAARGRTVLMDASAPELSMRARARELIPDFAEVHVACGLQTAMEREAQRPGGQVMAGLYEKALRRRDAGERFEGLGDVIGVDVPFEADPDAELTLDAEALAPDRAAARVLAWLDARDAADNP
jgi:adenylylsulfate kinase